MYLSADEVDHLSRLLKSFYTLPYSSDLSGKDAETLLRIVKKAKGELSRKKELFDIVDGETGYSVKTLQKALSATRVDIQEQRFGDVAEVRRLVASGDKNETEQGRLVLTYMQNRLQKGMQQRGVKVARSLILLKNWNKARTRFEFRYWEEDFQAYINTLLERHNAGEIEWIKQDAGLHGRDRLRSDDNGNHVRLIRMHYKHNQIFTDHDIPPDALRIKFTVNPISWERVIELLGMGEDLELGKVAEVTTVQDSLWS